MDIPNKRRTEKLENKQKLMKNKKGKPANKIQDLQIF